MNMVRKKRVLFISHEASNTGAPILFLNLIKIVKAKGEYDIDILCIKDGPLLKEFKKYGTVFHLKPGDYSLENNRVKLLQDRMNILFRMISAIPMWLRADLIFNNTCVNGRYLKFFSQFKRADIVSYIHELEKFICSDDVKNDADQTIDLSRRIISPNDYNKKVLRQIFNIPEYKCDILRYNIIDNTNLHSLEAVRKAKLEAKRHFLEKYKLDKNSCLVLGMGMFDVRKGADLFVETANKLKNENIEFIWIGDHQRKEFLNEINEYIDNHKVTNFHYLGGMKYDLKNFLPYDLLFLSSREDPYPLVVLEAALMGIPCVYYAKGGGMIEFVSADAGWPIETIDTLHAASTINTAISKGFTAKSETAYHRAKEWHTNEDNIYSQFMHAISLQDGK